MLSLILSVFFILFAIFFLTLSKSKKNYQKLVQNTDEQFANKANKGLTICGYLLLLCSLFWLANTLL